MGGVSVEPRVPHRGDHNLWRLDGKFEDGKTLCERKGAGQAGTQHAPRHLRDDVRLAGDAQRIRETGDDGNNPASQAELCQGAVDWTLEDSLARSHDVLAICVSSWRHGTRKQRMTGSSHPDEAVAEDGSNPYLWRGIPQNANL